MFLWMLFPAITLPESLRAIKAKAFYGCLILTSVTFPDDLMVIENLAFYECSSLTYVSMSKWLEDIGDWAFYGCDNLTYVYMQDSPFVYDHIQTTHRIPDLEYITFIVEPDSVAARLVKDNGFTCIYPDAVE